MTTVTLAQYYYGFEGSVAVKVFMVGFAVLAAIAATFVRLKPLHWIMLAALFATALTAPTNQDQTAFLPTWMLRVQLHRAEIHLTLGILLSLFVVFSGRVHMHTVPAQGLFLLAISLYAGLFQFFHEGPKEALQSIGFALAVIPCMLFAAPAACRDYDGCMKTLRAIMVASVAWTVCSSVQFVINPRFLVNTQGRFWGMLANAQQAAMLCAPFAIIALWLLLNDKNRRLRLLWLGLIGINLLFVAWTASRTGVLMLVLGAAFVLYNRLGKLVLLLPVGGVLLFGLSFLADELQITSNIERLTSTENTRAGVWSAQLANIMESPIIGVGWHETGGSESSWLGGFAGYGLGMFLLMVAFLAWSMWRCASLWIRRRRLPREYRPMIDMYISWNAMYFGAATFEGIILGRSSTSQVLLLMFAGIGVWLVEQTQLVMERSAEDDESDEPPLYDEHLAHDYGFDDGHSYPPRRQPA
jgi:hypothetical protein